MEFNSSTNEKTKKGEQHKLLKKHGKLSEHLFKQNKRVA